MDLLQAIVQRLDRSGVPDSKFPNAKGEYWAHCPLPEHTDRTPTNFSVSERGFNCFGCNGHGSLKDLADILGVEVERRGAGVTLEQYAAAKRLPPGFLRTLGLKDAQWFGKPAIDMPYKDEAGKLLRMRKRVALRKDKRSKRDSRFRWDKGDGQYIYGLWLLEEMERHGWILLVEGESDCQTAWAYGLPALGVPGANNWDKAKGNLVPRLAALDVYVWREPDQGGDKFIQGLQHDLPNARVIIPTESVKDLSDAHLAGKDVVALLEELKRDATPILQIKAISETADNLAAFAPWVHEKLGERSDRDTKVEIANALCAWFLAKRRLIVDTGQDQMKGGRPYLVSDEGALWPLSKDAVSTRLTLYDAGLNGTEAPYLWIMEALTMEAYRAGQHLALRRWQHHHEETLYVSCGPCHLARCHGEQLEILPNGTDGVWFAGDAAYPVWEVAEPIEPLSLAAYNANVVRPDEVKTYTVEVQRSLLTVWLAVLLSGLRPLPLLSSIGMNGGGKTTLVKAIERTLLGPSADITSIPEKVGDFQVQITTAPVAGFDNADTNVPTWFQDELAAALTGRNVEERQLYTNGIKLTRPVTAALAVTTRTASFCRADIAQRALPILTDEFGDDDRKGDQELMAEVDAHRDGLMSWCVRTAARLLAVRREAPPGLPLRFVDFARMVWAHQYLAGQPTQAAHMLLALRKAQALVVGEADPLVEAIGVYFQDIATNGYWEGTPTELVKALSGAGADLPYLGGGKRIARQLREAKKTLELMAIDLSENRSGNQTLFSLHSDESRANALGESGESGDCYSAKLRDISDHECGGEEIGQSPDSPDSPSTPPPPPRQMGHDSDDEEPDEGPWYIN